MSSLNNVNIGAECADEEENDTTFSAGSDAIVTCRAGGKLNRSREIFALRASIVVLVVCLIATTTFYIVLTMDSKKEGFNKEQFDSFAGKVLETFMDIAHGRMTSAGGLVVAIVAHGIDHRRSWPFVALSSFQQRSSTTKQLSGAISIRTHPIVWQEDRALWENYTTGNDPDTFWYPEGRAYQAELGIDDQDDQAQVQTDDPKLDLSSGIANHIYTVSDEAGGMASISPEERYYLPIWQTSPVSKRSVVNRDFAAKSQGITSCLDRDAVVFEGMQSSEPGYEDSPSPVTANMAWLLYHADGRKTRYEGDIFTTVYFPLYNNFEIDRSTVGVMSIVIHWARYFRRILPKQIQGIVFVLDNGCDEPYTYMINGEDVVPVGHGDLHDPKYDQYERRASFREIDNIPDGTKFGLLLYQGRCPYTIRVYPSDHFD